MNVSGSAQGQMERQFHHETVISTALFFSEQAYREQFHQEKVIHSIPLKMLPHFVVNNIYVAQKLTKSHRVQPEYKLNIEITTTSTSSTITTTTSAITSATSQKRGVT